MNQQETIDWQVILAALANELPESLMAAWVRPVEAVVEGRCLTLKVSSAFFLDGLKGQCLRSIQQLVSDLYGDDVRVKLSLGGHPPKLAETASKNHSHDKKALSASIDGPVDSRFTFDNFVVGSGNDFCFAASKAVSEQPGDMYNPLYIHGGVGLGKTHLINAIANHLRARHPYRIAYRTSESFTNEMIRAIQQRRQDAFRQRYRDVDLLIIDDVQFIAGKQSTQEEFFHTFNALYEMRKQIILTSDKPPKQIDNLDARLQSRFGCGLVADVSPPDLETRQAILSRKAELAGVRLPNDVRFMLASRITHNVRELEGALTRLTAHASLTGRTIDMDLVKLVLRDLLHVESRAIGVDDILKVIAQYYAVMPRDLLSKGRSRSIAQPRQVLMFLSKELTELSYPEIGKRIGGRDHSTVIHAVRKVRERMEASLEFSEEVEHLKGLCSR